MRFAAVALAVGTYVHLEDIWLTPTYLVQCTTVLVPLYLFLYNTPAGAKAMASFNIK